MIYIGRDKKKNYNNNDISFNGCISGIIRAIYLVETWPMKRIQHHTSIIISELVVDSSS